MRWTSPRRLYLTADGHVVEEGDPRAATLLVGAGGELDAAEAERLGLLAPPAAKAVAEPPATKHVEAPPTTKQRRRR
jgi:hypothetical protein